MPDLKIENDTASIVLVGSFNPAIFQPTWFASQQLIGANEGEGAAIEVVHPEVTKFQLDWLTLSVTRERFVAITTLTSYQAVLRDLVRGVFELLEHTPTTALGINRAMHFRLNDVAARNAVGDRLMPKEPWRGVAREARLLSLSATSERDDQLPGRLNVKVEPSSLYPDAVFIELNNDLRPTDGGASTAFAVATIRDHCERLFQDAETRAQRLLAATNVAKD